MKIEKLELKMNHLDFCEVVHAGVSEMMKTRYGKDEILIKQVDEITEEGESLFVIKVAFVYEESA
jgi:hypothetical protein